MFKHDIPLELTPRGLFLIDINAVAMAAKLALEGLVQSQASQTIRLLQRCPAKARDPASFSQALPAMVQNHIHVKIHHKSFVVGLASSPIREFSSDKEITVQLPCHGVLSNATSARMPPSEAAESDQSEPAVIEHRPDPP